MKRLTLYYGFATVLTLFFDVNAVASPFLIERVDSVSAADSLIEGNAINEVKVVAFRQGRTKAVGILNSDIINQKELFRAACCNLGESFTTNPSVDVNYADAATGHSKSNYLACQVLTYRCSRRISLIIVVPQLLIRSVTSQVHGCKVFRCLRDVHR